MQPHHFKATYIKPGVTSCPQLLHWPAIQQAVAKHGNLALLPAKGRQALYVKSCLHTTRLQYLLQANCTPLKNSNRQPRKHAAVYRHSMPAQTIACAAV
jgi:hypothetical protein